MSDEEVQHGEVGVVCQFVDPTAERLEDEDPQGSWNIGSDE